MLLSFMFSINADIGVFIIIIPHIIIRTVEKIYNPTTPISLLIISPTSIPNNPPLSSICPVEYELDIYPDVIIVLTTINLPEFINVKDRYVTNIKITFLPVDPLVFFAITNMPYKMR